MARACGSYPQCPEFKSQHRHHIHDKAQILLKCIFYYIIGVKKTKTDLYTMPMYRLIIKVTETIKKFSMLKEGDKIILAVSGGPDSICLLDILNRIKDELKISLVIAHVNHGIRGKEADREASFVSHKSSQLGIPFEQRTVSVPEIAKAKGLSVEQAGRIERYQFFQELLKIYQAQKIALGHHADDQVETLLMRLIRGSGLRGLAGIPAKRDVFIRPLIECTSQEIEEYCLLNNLPYCIDSTNREPSYLRNKIRLELIPFLNQKFQPTIAKNLLQLQAIIRDELDFWEEITEQYYQKVLQKELPNQVILSNQLLSKWPPGIQRAVIRRALKCLTDYLEDIQFNHIESIRLMCLKEEGEKYLDLPGGLRVRKSYEEIVFGLAQKIPITGKEKRFGTLKYELAVGQETKVRSLGLKFITKLYDYYRADFGKLSKKIDKNEAYLDYDKLNLPLRIRNRKPGDRFQPLNSNFYKKVKSFFIDQKIDRHQREKIMLVVDSSNQIVWITGYQIDNRFKITENTKKIIHIKQVTI